MEYNCSGVVLRASDGSTFWGSFALLTLPIGPLQAGSVRFLPPLPPRQRRALSHATMSNYTKVYAQWRAVWWDDSLPRWLVAGGGALVACRNLNHASHLPGSLTLQWDLAEPQASAWEAMSDGRARKEMLITLRRQFPTRNIPEPTDFLITRHGELRWHAI